MVYFTYKKLNICTVALLATVFAVLIAAMAVDWYQFKVEYSYTRISSTDSSLSSSLYNYTQTNFDMYGQTVQTQAANTKIVRTTQNTYAQLGASNVNQQFKIQQAFVLIALLTAGLLFVAHTLYHSTNLQPLVSAPKLLAVRLIHSLLLQLCHQSPRPLRGPAARVGHVR